MSQEHFVTRLAVVACADVLARLQAAIHASFGLAGHIDRAILQTLSRICRPVHTADGATRSTARRGLDSATLGFVRRVSGHHGARLSTVSTGADKRGCCQRRPVLRRGGAAIVAEHSRITSINRPSFQACVAPH